MFACSNDAHCDIQYAKFAIIKRNIYNSPNKFIDWICLWGISLLFSFRWIWHCVIKWVNCSKHFFLVNILVQWCKFQRMYETRDGGSAHCHESRPLPVGGYNYWCVDWSFASFSKVRRGKWERRIVLAFNGIAIARAEQL